MEQLSQFVIHHWELCAALVAILLLILINELISQKKAILSLSTQSAVEKINRDDATVFDIRNQELFSAGHIINAIRVSSNDFDQPRLQKYKAKPIIIVCAKGIEAQALGNKLKSQGFINTMVLAGGLAAWQAAGLPLIKGNK